ncbi:MAG: helix-turn-helix transcriptional regulator [Lachnospiraceae bacterium]|jgi:transcriptional regulator with XRE-family HTH domain|nr:helix-turn-helix transcriptional regulator [Lachnospiraceae bacterium]
MNGLQISLAAARVNAGLTQADAAKALNISVHLMRNWEKGRSELSVSQSRGLSELYAIPLDYIFLPIISN